MPMRASPLPANVLDALRRGNVIEAIKLLRESSGVGLKEAKDIIDEHQRGNPAPVVAVKSAGRLPSSVVEALKRRNKIVALAGEGSPGEVPKSGNVVWFLLAVAVAALVGYYFLRSAS